MSAADGQNDGDRTVDGSESDGSGSDGSGPDAPVIPVSRRARARSAALWGVVGGLSVLALAQGYRLVVAGSSPLGVGRLALVALAVAAASAGITYAAEARLLAKRRT